VLAEHARRGASTDAAAALLDLGGDAHAALFDAYRLGGARAGVEEAFAGRGDAEPFLLGVLRADNPVASSDALRLLARCGGAATVETIARLRLDARTFPAALDALGAIGGDEAARTLARLAVPGHERARLVRALGATGSAEAVPALARLAVDPELRAGACAALVALPGAAGAETLVDLLVARRDPAAGAALAAMPAGAVVPLLLARFGGADGGAVRRVLAQIAGADLGGRKESWKNWWDSRP
jgi:HEAT repeat protein